MAKGENRTEEEALLFIEPLLPLLQRGMSERQACEYAQIPESSLNLYKKKYLTVWSKIKRAKMVLIAQASDTVSKAVKEDANLALKVLEKRSRKQWGNNLDVTSDGEKINVALVEFINPDENTSTNTE